MSNPPSLACPECAHPLSMATVDSNQMWLCNSCGDFVMSKKEFETLVGAGLFGSLAPRASIRRGAASESTKDSVASPAREEPDHAGAHNVHNCPGCKGPMTGAQVGGAQIEYCGSCNIVHSDRASFNFIVDGAQTASLENTLLRMDVARNLSNVAAGHHVPKMKVDDLFVLFKNGILITSYTTDVPDEMDKDIMGSMLLAITNFVQSSFKTMGKGRSLSCIRFEDKEIAFEHGEYIVVALTLHGTLAPEDRKKIAAAIREIEISSGGTLRSWDGNIEHLRGIQDAFSKFVDPLRN